MTTAIAVQQLNAEQVDLIKRTICQGATNDELQLFIGQCNRTGLDPFSKQIHAVKRWDSVKRCEVMSIQVGVDGFRLVAERTGHLDGQDGPYWCGEDGVWKDVWLSSTPPVAAKVLVFRKGCTHPFTGVARFSAYAQTKKDGGLNSFWARMPDVMIAKVAECLALRKAFPHDLSGLYSPEEMRTEAEPEQAPQQQPRQEKRQQQRPAAIADKPKASGIPATGAELLSRMRTADAQLAAKGLIQPGAMLDYVRAAGVAAGHEDDMLLWNGPAIELAIRAAREFKASLADTHPEPPIDDEPPSPTPTPTTTAAPATQLTPQEIRATLDLLHDIGRGWSEARTRKYVCELLGITLAENDHVSVLTRDQYQILMGDLRKIKATADAKKAAKAGAA